MKKNDEHARLLLPYDPPLPATLGGRLPDIPSLWERAKEMFTRVIGHIGSTAAFSKRFVVRRRQRHELLQWLVPVEKLVRACLITRALAHLLMTAEGRKLLRDTPKMAMPEPPKPVGRKHSHKITIPCPGWHTIAQHQRALAEQQKLDKQRAVEAAARDPHDPCNWGCGFRVLGWRFPEPDRDQAPPKKEKLPSVWVTNLDSDPYWPLPEVNERRPERREPDPPALVLARRIEALSRILANPGPAISRLARFIASLPAEAFDALRIPSSRSYSTWLHGRRDFRQAEAHCSHAASVFCEIRPG